MVGMTPTTPSADPTPMCFALLLRTAAGGSTEILLGEKKTGFGVGKIVGPGGKIEAGETPAEATAREVKEETGIGVEAADLREVAILTFRFPARPSWDLRMWVYLGDRFTGEPTASDEIDCRWFPVAELPLERMWDDARLWLPRVLAGEYVDAEIGFADDCERVASVRTRPGAETSARTGPHRPPAA
jgi:8-oxo-dGTP diphosphatase